ncbi:MAG: ATP-dependent Clp protease proteolytic subunit [Spirochaetia bacterium]|nr:ATP-dependent Clp protease proteolytic subunit [Spirochaetia bacterium]
MDILKFESEKDSKPRNFKEKVQEQFINSRQIYLWGPVTDKSSEDVIEKMMFLENKEPGKPIYFFINSPGGVISSGMAVFDIMSMISSPVYTITMGMAASMGALLFAAGKKGHRYMFQHARVMIHQPLISGQIVAPAIDIKIHADEIKKTRLELNRILSEATGKSMDQIQKDTDRDYWLNAEEAIKYGIADKTLSDIKEINVDFSEKKAHNHKEAKEKTKPAKKPGK